VTITLTRVPTAESVTILLVTDFAYTSPLRTVVHNVIGRDTADFTVHPTGPRTGTFNLLCANETTAQAIEKLLRQSGPFTLVDTATTVANRKFMPTGDLALTLDPSTQTVCTVAVGYTETP
jgi:hypothetical protein